MSDYSIFEENSETKEPKDRKNITDEKVRSIVIGSLLAGVLGGILGVYIFGSAIGGTGTGGIFNRERVVVDEQSAIIHVVEKTKPAIVSVVGRKRVVTRNPQNDIFSLFPFRPGVPSQEEEREISSGTGFFVTSDGLIATNKHVVTDEEARYEVLTNDGNRYAAEVVARDPVNDIALLKIEGFGFPVLKLGDSDDIKVGQKVVAIGNALGQFTNTVTTGVVSGINRTIVATGQAFEVSQIEGAIQTDAAINPGNSGGPLLDLEGFVLGINTAISSQGQLLGFAIPVNDLKKDVEVYSERNRIVKPFMGVRYIMITEGLQQEMDLPVSEGALVTSGRSSEPAVVPGGPADQAGIQEGDVIISIDGEEVNLENSLARALRNLDPGETVEVRVLRDGSQRSINLTLGERTN